MDKGASAPVPHPPHYPFHDGSVIQLDYYPEDPSKSRGACKAVTLSLKVVKTLAHTYSCVLLVQFVSSVRDSSYATRILRSRRLPPPTKMVLKLCDRRFATGLRADYEASDWTPEIEGKLAAFHALPDDMRPEVRVSDDIEGDSWHDGDDQDAQNRESGGGANGASSEGTQVGSAEKLWNGHWTDGHREQYLQKWCDKLYAQELEAYRTLVDVQGEKIPILYGTVQLRDKARRSQQIPLVQGLLMEYKNPSFPLRAIPKRIPDRGLWHDIGKAAVKLVQDVGDMGVLNRDIRLDNILVVPVQQQLASSPNNSWEIIPSFRAPPVREHPEPKEFKVFMIDFGITRVQGEDETDEEFRKARRNQDEEGAIGYILEEYLKRHAGDSQDEKPFIFNHSRRLDRARDDEDADI